MFGITIPELEILAFLLPIDAFNLYLLIRLWKWSQTAGKNLISQVIKALNLNYGGHEEKIGEAIKSETLRNFADSLPEELQNQIPKGIDIPALVQAFIRGEIKKEDIIRFAPIILKKLQSDAGQTGPSSGRW